MGDTRRGRTGKEMSRTRRVNTDLLMRGTTAQPRTESAVRVTLVPAVVVTLPG